ncbi:hypothetical protein X975_00626, partial [Stegodyphus mimosarum]
MHPEQAAAKASTVNNVPIQNSVRRLVSKTCHTYQRLNHFTRSRFHVTEHYSSRALQRKSHQHHLPVKISELH